MNKLPVFGAEAELIARALDELHASTGIQGKILDDTADESNAVVSLKINGQHLKYNCTVKKKVDRYALPLDLLNRLDNVQHTLLVSAPLSQDMANRCRELGLQFIDTAGNAHIKDEAGIYVFVSGRRSNTPYHTPANTTMTPALLKMMFAFLAEPALLNAPYRDISFRARVSTGAIGNAFDTLEQHGLIGMTPDGKRMIRMPEMFLNTWAAGYAGRLKPKLRQYRFATEDLTKILGWNPEFRVSAWGGEPAALHLTGHLKPEHGLIYADMDDPDMLRNIVKEFRLRADPQGTLEIVEMFWNPDAFTTWFPTVPPHLVYADLMATHDSRNIAAARQIVSQVIDHVQDTA